MTTQSLTVTRTYPAPARVLWPLADPGHLAAHIGELRLTGWKQSGPLAAGTRVEEIHVVGGLPAVYNGEIISAEKNRQWSMVTRPRHRWPFGLPHSVRYDFEPVGPRACRVRITCRFTCQGLLAFPLFRWLVARGMRSALGAVHDFLGRQIRRPASKRNNQK